MNDKATKMRRRDFLRGGALIGLLAGTGRLILDPNRRKCAINDLCKNCGQFVQCDLPDAIQTRLREGSS